MRLALIVTLAAALPAMAEVEPQCRATSPDGAPVTAMTRAGGKKALSQIPSGTIVTSTEIKAVAGQDWYKVSPDSALSRNDGYVKASEMTCEGKVSTLWDQKNDPDYDDNDPEFYCAWPIKPGMTGKMISEFSFLNMEEYGSDPKADITEIPGQPLPIRLWVDARYEYEGEDWLRGMYFDEENTVGWIPASAMVCD